MRLGVPVQQPQLPAHGGVAVLEASSPDGSPDRPLTTGLRPVRADAPVAPPVADRLPSFRRQRVATLRGIIAFFPEKEHLDVHRLAPAVLVGEL